MSLITRCPTCGTMFKVVPDQLRISEGWVRCGHCTEVFDASANLQDVSAVVATPDRSAQQAGAGEPAHADEPAGFGADEPPAFEADEPPAFGADKPPAFGAGAHPALAAEEPIEQAVAAESLLSRADRREPVAPQPSGYSGHPGYSGHSGWGGAAPTFSGGEDPTYSGFATTFDGHEESILAEEPDEEEIEAQARALGEQPGDQPFTLRRADLVEPDTEAPGAPPPPGVAAAQPLQEWAPEREPQARESQLHEPELHELSFVRQGERRRFWGRSGMRAALAALALVLLGLLGLQVAYHERDRLAALEPAWKPWLSAMCSTLGCSLGVARQIESIVVDGSSFNRQRGDTYRLTLTLRNQAALAVALPAIELTLTDAQDQALVRRVLLPSEIAPGTAVIAARSEWSGHVALAVDGGVAGDRIAGYRVLAFYP